MVVPMAAAHDGAPRVDEKHEITRLLLAWSDGNEEALSRLMPLVAAELRRIAQRYFESEDSGHTLQPTALVNELYLCLADRQRVSWKNRAHFFGFAAQTMRRILVDHARIRRAQKRDRGVKPLPLEGAIPLEVPRDQELILLNDALESLARIDPRQARIVELRFFVGLSHQEIGEVLGVTDRTVKREWRTARLWLHQEMVP